MQSHRLSGETVTRRAPLSETEAGMSSFCTRSVPRSSPLRRLTEKILMLDIVAITRIFPSLESVADVMFSSPCSRKDRQNAHKNFKTCVFRYLNQNFSNQPMPLPVRNFVYRSWTTRHLPNVDLSIPKAHYQSRRGRRNDRRYLRKALEVSMVLFSEFS